VVSSYIETLVYPSHDFLGAGDPVTDYESVSYKRMRMVAGTGTLTCPYGSTASKRIVQAHDDIVGIRCHLIDVSPDGTETIRDRFTGWAGDYKASGPYGQKTVTTTMVGAWAVLSSILAWAAPGLALGVQPGYDVYIGPAVTGILGYIRRNAERMRMPLITIPPTGPDTSYLMNWAARFTPIDELIKDTLPEMAQTLDVSIWLPGDPQPAGQALTVPTFVVQFLNPVTRPGVVLEESADGVVAEIAGKAPTATAVIVGGKSPDWLNNIISGAIDQVFPAWKDALKNVFLAYQQFNQPPPHNWGLFAPREVYKGGGTSAYTVDAIQAGRQGALDAQGRRTRALTFTDGHPYTYNIDFGLGDIIGGLTELDTDVVMDTVGSVTVADNRAEGLTVTATLGEDKPPQDGIAHLIARVKNLLAMVGTIQQGSA